MPFLLNPMAKSNKKSGRKIPSLFLPMLPILPTVQSRREQSKALRYCSMARCGRKRKQPQGFHRLGAFARARARAWHIVYLRQDKSPIWIEQIQFGTNLALWTLILCMPTGLKKKGQCTKR